MHRRAEEINETTKQWVRHRSLKLSNDRAIDTSRTYHDVGNIKRELLDLVERREEALIMRAHEDG